MSAYAYALLIEKHGAEIARVVSKNRAVVIKGPTGCGKSTFVPLLFKDARVAIVEPRRIAVTSLYNTLLPHIPTLGFKMRFSKRVDKNTTVTIFTDGCFLNEIESLEYDYIIIDEVHERTVRTDIILGVLRGSYRGKLIMMSASVDTAKFERYFGAKTYEIPGKSFPADLRYLEKPASDYIVESYMTIKNILTTRAPGEKKDILVFLPGEEDINELQQLCRRIPSISVYKVHSSMDDREQSRIYEPNDLTRVILSTNICETSLTIPNVRYVVDTGLCKTKVYDDIGYLGIQPTNSESAVQRTGRCNRLGPGVCYRLYTEFEILPSYVPEIMRCDMSTVILQLTALGKNVLSFDFLDFPPIKNCKAALEFLLGKGCIECLHKNKVIQAVHSAAPAVLGDTAETSAFVDYSRLLMDIGFRITGYGRRLSLHPFDVHLAHFYEQCICGGAGYYGALLLSLVSQENYNFMNQQLKNVPDILYLINLLREYREAGDRHGYCVKRSLPYKGMETACRIFQALNRKQEGDAGQIERIFSSAFSHNLCLREKDGSFRMQRNGLQIYIHPSSAFFKRNDKKIVVVDVFCTTKNYARVVGKYYE